jgi:hypothetical protein
VSVCKLSRRAGTAKLTASTVAGTAGDEGEVLTAHSEGVGDGAWRLIDLWSDEGTPWQARVSWSGGGGAQRTAKIDVPNSVRLCIHATMVQVFGANLSTSANIQARAAIADGQGETENQWTVRGFSDGQVGGGGGTVDVSPPPWAKFVRLELSDSTLLPTAFLELRDANATSRARYAASAQPQPGAPVGDAASIHLVLPAGTYAWRLVFLLHL